MKNQKGMGHITTILSIMIISLLVVGILYYTKTKAQSEKVKNYETDMLLIQGKVKILSQESAIQKNEELLKGRKVSENLEDKEIVQLLENNVISQDEESFSNYYILEKENLNEMGLNSVELNEGYYIVNYKTYEIIYSKGVNIEENTFYKLSELQEYDKAKENAQEEVKQEKTEDILENIEENVENQGE